MRYDRQGDQHYDVISAFIKSIRGSDPDAALHYLARMLVAGEDPRFIARRLMVHASEDVGLADPTALQAATAAAQVVQLVGLPECRIALAQATLHLATAPKSNAVVTAIDAAMSDVRGGAVGAVPAHLRDGHYAGAQKLGNAVGYRYPPDDPDGVVAQQYAPDELVGRDYYTPTRAAPSARCPTAWTASAGSPAERTDVHRELHGAVGPVRRGVPLAHHEVQVGQGAAGHDVAAVELGHPARGVVLVVPAHAPQHGGAGRDVQVGDGGVQHEHVHAVVAVVEQREHPPVLDPSQRQLAEAAGQHDRRRAAPAPAVFA